MPKDGLILIWELDMNLVPTLMVRVSSLLQSWSKAVGCISTPRMYPHSGYFLVSTISTRR